MRLRVEKVKFHSFFLLDRTEVKFGSLFACGSPMAKDASLKLVSIRRRVAAPESRLRERELETVPECT